MQTLLGMAALAWYLPSLVQESFTLAAAVAEIFTPQTAWAL
jgi:hypothetical protein